MVQQRPEGYMERLDIKVGFHCNNMCLFCVQGGRRETHGNKTTEQVREILETHAGRAGGVVFTGGEPTIRPEIFDWVALAAALGYPVIQVQSNGRMLSYRPFCERIVAAGATEFALALHGHTPGLHDALTRSPGSFVQTCRGIVNLTEMGQRVILNTVITRPNYRRLPQIAQLLIALRVPQFQFAFVHAMGAALTNFDAMVPRKSRVEPYVKQALEIGLDNGARAMTEAIPYCFMQGYEPCVAEAVIPDTKVFDAAMVIDDFTAFRKARGKAMGPPCKACRMNARCEGPWKEYPERFGWDEFKPLV